MSEPSIATVDAGVVSESAGGVGALAVRSFQHAITSRVAAEGDHAAIHEDGP
jgi:hypothetical protein